MTLLIIERLEGFARELIAANGAAGAAGVGRRWLRQGRSACMPSSVYVEEDKRKTREFG